MKNKLSRQACGGRVRIIDLYQDTRWHFAKADIANTGMSADECFMARIENGRAAIFTCRAATPEPVSDEALQAIRDNCAIHIVLASEDTAPAALKEGHAHD